MQRVGGVSRYFYENIIRISSMHDVIICTKYNSNEYIKQIMNKSTFKYNGLQKIRVRIFIEQLYLIFRLVFSKYDIVHLTGTESFAFSFVKRPVVVTIHDMIAEKFYNSKKRISRKKKTIMKADAIICVSQNTKNDLIRYYPNVNQDKIHVIYHGFNTIKYKYRKIVSKKYILYVGSRYSEYKNFAFFLTAISGLLKDYGIYLVCTGDNFSFLEKECIKKNDIVNNVMLLGFVKDEELASLYHYAECFVYPSLYEGFGIPILEAFSHDCPVCISNTSCFPEVAGDAASYFDPNDKESIVLALKQVLNNENYRNQLIKKGRERLRFFSWDKASDAHVKIYESLKCKK